MFRNAKHENPKALKIHSIGMATLKKRCQVQRHFGITFLLLSKTTGVSHNIYHVAMLVTYAKFSMLYYKLKQNQFWTSFKIAVKAGVNPKNCLA